MAGPYNQNPKGRRLIPVLLKQGLMLLPLSLNTLGKMASFKVQIYRRKVLQEQGFSNPRRLKP
jgi:hypothetical protein